MENDFPSNANRAREKKSIETPDRSSSKEKDIRRVTTSKVIRREKPLRKRFVESFTGDANKGVVEHLLMDVVGPGMKDLFVFTGTTALERLFYGDSAGSGSRRPGGGYTSYRGMSSGRPRERREREPRDREERRSSPRRSSSAHQEIVLGSRVEAEETLDQMNEILSKYNEVSVRDLLSMVGEPSRDFTDEDWGWTDLRGSRIHHVGRGGYLLDLPNPEPLG